jgi:hypothetical protein
MIWDFIYFPNYWVNDDYPNQSGATFLKLKKYKISSFLLYIFDYLGQNKIQIISIKF